MSVITKQDLQDWSSNPVTRAISKKLEEQVKYMKSESCLRDTCDQTAMQVARNEGTVEGVEALNEVYADMLEEAES